MDHQHTWLLFDCRPMKAAAHRVIDDVEAGRLEPPEAGRRLGALAASLPDLEPKKYERELGKLLAMNEPDRARKLVDCLSDETLRPWVRPTVAAGWFVVKWSAIFGAIALVVWLVTR